MNWKLSCGTRRCSCIPRTCDLTIRQPASPKLVIHCNFLGQCRWATLAETSKQSETRKQNLSPGFLMMLRDGNNDAQGFSLNTVACWRAPKNDPVVTAFNFLNSTNKQQNTRRQECVNGIVSYSHFAPYHSEKIPAH